MHVHTSISNKATERNIFVDENGEQTDEFLHAIAGMQRHLSGAMALMAPYVNSYRRRTGVEDSPANLAWGMDNRTVGLRVPLSNPKVDGSKIVCLALMPILTLRLPQHWLPSGWAPGEKVAKPSPQRQW